MSGVPEGKDPFGESPERLASSRRDLVRALRSEISDDRVLVALASVPRENFVSPDLRGRAYDNRPLPIGHGQTTSQPLMIALMLQALGLRGGEKVLEVGSGCGYQTALLSLMADQVIAVELVPGLVNAAERALRTLSVENVQMHVAGEDLGWPAAAPYDAIVVSAAAPRVPISLVEQLSPEATLVIPVGSIRGQDLMVVNREDGALKVTRKGGCSFVPLLGPEAFSSKADLHS